MNPVTIKLWDVGRRKWSGEVEAPSMRMVDIVHTIYKTARKHLGSRDISIRQPSDDSDGSIFVGGCRAVGRWNFA